MTDNKRDLQGSWLTLSRFLFALLPIVAIVYALQILPEFGIVIYKEQFLVVMLTLSLILTFMTIPPFKTKEGGQKQTSVPWYDLILIAAILGAGGYTASFYHVLLPQLGLLTTDKILVSIIGIVSLLEATRRAAGWSMVAIGLLALAYALLGHNLTGLFETRVIRFDRLMQYNYLGQGAVHGIPLFVASTVVALFILFGQMLFAVGAGQAISDFAFALMGRRRGGAAKVSVVASALFGSLSGSASANVATTGMITIPMMRKTGYADHQAAAIEAVASTGGLILPPIMAATGFIMAEFLAIPYSEVAFAALLPALLFYLCIFMQVDLEAAKRGLHGWTEEDLPKVKSSLIAVLPVIFPVAVLLYSLFGLHQSAQLSAFYATIATVLTSLAVPSMRRKLKDYVDVFIGSGEAIIYVCVITGIAGLVMGCLGITGLGGNLSQKLVEVAGGNTWLLLVLAAFGSIVLGMGVPVTATYIILVILVGPALVSVGIPELAAHMFVFYYGTLSFLTPPVAISVFVAAAIAKSGPMKTAFFALRLAIVAYIIPYLFVFNQSYFLEGSTLQIVQTVISASVGILFLSVGLVGFFGARLNLPVRVLSIAIGVAGLWLGPTHTTACLALIVLAIGFAYWQNSLPFVNRRPQSSA